MTVRLPESLLLNLLQNRHVLHNFLYLLYFSWKKIVGYSYCKDYFLQYVDYCASLINYDCYLHYCIVNFVTFYSFLTTSILISASKQVTTYWVSVHRIYPKQYIISSFFIDLIENDRGNSKKNKLQLFFRLLFPFENLVSFR